MYPRLDPIAAQQYWFSVRDDRPAAIADGLRFDENADLALRMKWTLRHVRDELVK